MIYGLFLNAQKCEKKKNTQNMKTGISFKKIEYGSKAYVESVKLRSEILRKPLGLTFTDEELSTEKNQFHFAAYLNETLCGILILSPFSEVGSNSIRMRQVAVSLALQKKGIGKHLVQFSEKWAKKHQYSEMFLHAREEAVKFYLSMDYQVVSDVFFEVGIPHYKMHKELN
jgi:predicted GNAT family N-acyltransferase